MALKILKILFIFLLTGLFYSCALEDEDAGPMVDRDDMDLDDFVIRHYSWNHSINSNSDTSKIDTLSHFPTQKEIMEHALDYVITMQTLSADIVHSLRTTVSTVEKSNSWMNFYSVYYGAFVSKNDSRVKQWELDTLVEYENRKWEYRLKISDLPDGTMTGRSNNALEFYYDRDFRHGIMIYSPSHINTVRYPEKVMGHGMTCKLYFVNDGGIKENTLYVSNYGDNASVDRMRNGFISLKQSNGMISMACVIDMPYLWFDTKDNMGYSLAMFGGVDWDNGNMAVFPAFTPNTSTENITGNFVETNSIENNISEYMTMWASGQSISIDIDTMPKYQSPSFLSMGQYVGSGREIGDRSMFMKALSKAEDSKNELLPVSPFKLSILQLEWQK